ncbi:MAG TPA: type III-A CRISPR-associated protein Csm2 [Thiothrix sp.]|nr:type III-A CRISPR-associated protein Csm2 [Thiothrix sp.]
MALINNVLSKIRLSNITADLFSEVAQETARIIARDDKNNKPTQLRRFYDEIIMWDTRINTQPSKEKRDEVFNESLPFIRMMNAKVAYAKGRDLVNDDYLNLLNHCLKEVNDPESMRHFKLFMEAFMGFYKLEESESKRLKNKRL